MLVGLTGYAGAGKDLAAAGLLAIGWKRVSFAEPIRNMLMTLDPIVDRSGTRLSKYLELYGWNDAKFEAPEIRRLLQVFGTEVVNNMIDDELWTKLAKKEIDRHHAAGNSVVITDVRFPNEVAMIRFNGGKIIRIIRPGVKPAQNHASDTNVDLLSVDHEIINSGSREDLQNTLKDVLGIE